MQRVPRSRENRTAEKLAPDVVRVVRPDRDPDGDEKEGGTGWYTGEIRGVPSFREGKVTRLELWLAAHGETIKSVVKSTFYSDSHNDLPLLEQVTHPVAVDPDASLRAQAVARGWPVMSLG